MAEEKRLQMERGSIGGSYFVVKLPDGSTEKRLKVSIIFYLFLEDSFETVESFY